MRSPALICLLLAGSALGLDLKPSLAPSKPAAPANPPARPATPAPVAPVPAVKKDTGKAESPKAEATKEAEPAVLPLAKFANDVSVRADYRGIQVLGAGFVARGPRDFLEVRLAGAEGKAEALCHVRLLNAEGKAIGYLKAYLHAKGTTFDLASVERDPAKRRAVLERTLSIQFQGIDQNEQVLPAVCRRVP
ncbi:MAG: hypothetical protein ACKO3A_07765 [Opitutia bacterium]